MAIEEILAAIEAENERTIEVIAAEADARAARSSAEARDRADTERATLAKSRDDAAALASARIVNRARLGAERMMRAAREQLYAEAHDRMLSRLGGVRELSAYDQLLRRLLAEARAVLPDARVVLVDARDVGVMQRVVGEEPILVKESLETLGGLELVADDGRRVRNTLESRAEKAAAPLRRLAITIIPELGGER